MRPNRVGRGIAERRDCREEMCSCGNRAVERRDYRGGRETLRKRTGIEERGRQRHRRRKR